MFNKIFNRFKNKGKSEIKYLKIRKINAVGVWQGIDKYDSPMAIAEEGAIYIAMNKAGKYGMLDAFHMELLSFEYDSITPLGFSLWEIRKKGKAGAIQLDSSNNRLYISWQIPCKYDYIYADNDCVIKASQYDKDNDITDIYFPKINLMIPNACCISISWDYYDIMEIGIDKNKKRYLINAKDGNKYPIDINCVIIGSKETDHGAFLMIEFCNKGIRENGMIIKLSEDGVIGKTELYDDIPTVIYGPDQNGMDEAYPIAFIAEKKGLFYYIDKELKEHKPIFKSLSVKNDINGETIEGKMIMGSISEYLVKKESRVIYRNIV